MKCKSCGYIYDSEHIRMTEVQMGGHDLLDLIFKCQGCGALYHTTVDTTKFELISSGDTPK